MGRKAYQSDVSDAEWQIIEPLLPKAQPVGRPREVDLREIINGIFYVLREGCTWRGLPHDLPPQANSLQLFSALAVFRSRVLVVRTLHE